MPWAKYENPISFDKRSGVSVFVAIISKFHLGIDCGGKFTSLQINKEISAVRYLDPQIIRDETPVLMAFLIKRLGLRIPAKQDRDITRGFLRLKFRLPIGDFMPSDMLYEHLATVLPKEHIIPSLVRYSHNRPDREIVNKLQNSIAAGLGRGQLRKLGAHLKLQGIQLPIGVSTLKGLMEIHEKPIYRFRELQISEQPLLPKSYLFIENYLFHQHWYLQYLKKYQMQNYTTKQDPVEFTSLPAFLDSTNQSMHETRSYFMLDFRDFVEYATSDLVQKASIEPFQKNHIYFYEALNGTYEEPLFDYGMGGFSIVAAALSRRELGNSSMLGICGQFRLHLPPNKSSDEVPINKRFFETLMPQQHNFPFMFAHIMLVDNGQNNPLEWSRCEIYPPIVMRKNLYGIRPTGQVLKAMFPPETGDMIFPVNSTLNLLRERHEPLIDESLFETTRLLVHLPHYFDFMYDLVIEDERSPLEDLAGKGTASKEAHPPKPKPVVDREIAYRLVKSIRVNYLSEEALRKRHNVAKRTWTAPSYEFLVRGHWRKLRSDLSKGHDFLGNIIYGKTWVKEYFKGKEYGDLNTVKVNPHVTIKLKQPLSYARDVIKSYNLTSQTTPEQTLPDNVDGTSDTFEKTIKEPQDTPTAEWVYNERIKLTAGLRWMILKRDNFRCCICGKGAEEGVKLEVDHKRPVKKWGKTEEENLWTMCGSCNRGKGVTYQDLPNELNLPTSG